MTNFNEDGRGLSLGQEYADQIKQIRERLLPPLVRYSRSKFGTQRSDVSRVVIIFCVLFSRSINNGTGAPVQPLFLRGVARSLFLWSKHIFVLLLFAVVTVKANAQFYKPSALTIRKGESIPEATMQRNLQVIHMKTGEVTTLKLDDHKDKLIILDFWASW